MFQKNVTKTPFQIEREAKYLSMYKKRVQLRAIEGSKKGVIDKLLMEEFGIYTANAISVICKNVEKRLAAETV